MKLRIALSVLVVSLGASSALLAQDVKPASQAEVDKLTQRITQLEEQLAMLKKQADERQATYTAFQTSTNSQLAQFTQRLDLQHSDGAAFFAMLRQWHAAIEAFHTSYCVTNNCQGHFLTGLYRFSNGVLGQYGGGFGASY